MSEAATTDKREHIRLTPEQIRRQKARSLAIAVALALFVGLLYVVTIAKLGANVLDRAL
jgi:hypothetical protein